ncbi:MAG: DUF3820 family protein [Candidatus Omnitrophica bacterium]|nr:DUF3820 family protein [Candidatus Omnitrophota bacterium]MBU4479727.1 DUF3820 family protein [Candidatus Omnitrophota bacterium]MCG2703215.1 DUF3820 family protein [Candidatus Omnitrophota bacterium]
MIPDQEYLLKLVQMRMPFGKYKGCLLIDLPEPYLVWLSQKGFKQDELGNMLQSVYEIKLNGLEYLLKPIRPGQKQDK